MIIAYQWEKCNINLLNLSKKNKKFTENQLTFFKKFGYAKLTLIKFFVIIKNMRLWRNWQTR